MVEIILEQEFYSGDGDPGLMISDAQKLLFPDSFLNGSPLNATIEDVYNGSHVIDSTVLTGGLTERHPWNNAYWLLYFTLVSFDPRPTDILRFESGGFWRNLNNTTQT